MEWEGEKENQSTGVLCGHYPQDHRERTPLVSQDQGNPAGAQEDIFNGWRPKVFIVLILCYCVICWMAWFLLNRPIEGIRVVGSNTTVKYCSIKAQSMLCGIKIEKGVTNCTISYNVIDSSNIGIIA